MNTLLRRSAALVAAFAVLPGLAIAKPSMETVLTQVQSVAQVSDSAISPDGTRVAWSQSLHRQTSLWIEELKTHARVRLTAGDGKEYAEEGDLAWSPDGSRISFLSDAQTAGHMQLYVADADGGNVTRVGNLTGDAAEMHWSPDGKRIAFLYIPHPHRKAGAVSAGARAVGVIGSENDEQQIATVNVATGAIVLVTPPDDYVYEYDWAPSGARFVCTYARGNGDNNWWIAKLATIPSGGGTLKVLLSPSYQMNQPKWSPDGKSIAIVGGLMSDFGPVGGDVYLVDPVTGAARDATPGTRYSPAALHWLAPGKLSIVANRDGSLHLVTLDTATGAITERIGGDESLRSVSYAANGTVALVRTSFTRPPEVWYGTPGALHQLTSANAGAPRLNGKAVSLHWQSDQFTVQGWLVYPNDYQPGKTYPLITIIHGGPSAASTPGYGNLFNAALTASGYFVFMPNPRGSHGQGEAFTRANRKDFGYGDWRDDLRGVDAAIKAAPIDPHRLGLFGWSYGGYMGMWAETQTTRFKAIVAGAGVANWQSYYGQNNINQWMIPFFGASVYDDPAVYAKSSPITFIKNSRTPMLILQGERDEEVPAPQAFEFYNALQTLGVPSRLVVYADEGHGIRQPKNVVDMLERTIAWFDNYLR
jgi:dipeptidyl aminopeptidase/acylaminoacyl peptidase